VLSIRKILTVATAAAVAVAGSIAVTSQANAVSEVPLYAGEDVESGGLMRRGLDALAHLAFKWVPL
jgi:hypothetical protein